MPRVATPGLDPDAVVARLGEDVVRIRDLAPEIAMRLYRIEVDLHSLLVREAERLVARRLLEAEASARGVDLPALLAAEVDDRVTPPTEAEIDAYLEAHPAERGDPATVRARVRAYLSERQRHEQRAAFEARLRAARDVEVLLEPPVRPTVRLALDGAPVRGPDDAPLTIVLHGALGQWHTVEAARWVARASEAHPGQIRFAFRHFLPAGDEASLGAAMLLRHAQARGRFWPLFDRLVLLDGRLDEEAVRAAARDAGLDLDAFAAERRDGVWIGPLRDEIAAGRRAGVEEPPGLFVAGEWVHPSYGEDAFRAAVRRALDAAG